MLLTANLFPLLCLSVASVLNTVAIAYHSLAAVPFFYIVAVMLLWICVSCPLCLLGTVSSPTAAVGARSACHIGSRPRMGHLCGLPHAVHVMAAQIRGCRALPGVCMQPVVCQSIMTWQSRRRKGVGQGI
jgi:hypothetical protein